MNRTAKKTRMVPLPSQSIIPERDKAQKPILEVHRLGINFGGLVAVEDFNIAVGRTEICRFNRSKRCRKNNHFQLAYKSLQTYERRNFTGRQRPRLT